MNIETYFEEQKGITVDAARNARAKYTAIDMCRFAKNYHESEVENLDIQRVSQQSELLFEFNEWVANDRRSTTVKQLVDGFIKEKFK